MKPILTIRESAKPPAKMLSRLRESYEVLIVKYHDDVRLVQPAAEPTELLLDFALTAMRDNWQGARDAFAKMVTDHVVKTRSLRRQEKKLKKVEGRVA